LKKSNPLLKNDQRPCCRKIRGSVNIYSHIFLS
jgi:hypothetical protein